LFVSASFLFFLFLEKMVGIPMQKVSYVMFKVAVEIANICFVLFFLSENGGCAGVTKRRQLHIFFAVWLVMFFCHLTMLLLCVSFFGSYALWLIFNSAIKVILKSAFGDGG